MIKTSCVARPIDDLFLVIRSCYLKLCNGNTVAAGLIHFFETWHNFKIVKAQENKRMNDVAERHGDQRPQDESLYQWHSMEEMEEALMGIGKKNAILEARDMLVSLGIISLHKNPNPRYNFDRTTHYLFYPEVVTMLLADRLKMTDRPLENQRPSFENGQAIPNHTSKDPKRETSAQSRGAQEKKVIKKKAPPGEKKEARPAREHWQAFVDTWHDFTAAKLNGETPSIVGRHLTELGKLYDLLQLRAKKKQQAWTQEYMIKALRFFLEIAYAEEWLKKHWLLKNLVDQFDAIFAREAQKQVVSKKPADLQYIIDRYFEGQLDDRVLTAEIYKQLVSLKLIPEDHWGNFVHPKVPNATPGDATVAAIKDWLSKQTKPNA